MFYGIACNCMYNIEQIEIKLNLNPKLKINAVEFYAIISKQSFLWNSRLRLSESRQRAAECFTSRVVGRRKSIRRTRKLLRDFADESRRTRIGHRNCATYSKYIIIVNCYSPPIKISWKTDLIGTMDRKIILSITYMRYNIIVSLIQYYCIFYWRKYNNHVAFSRSKWNIISSRMAHLTYTNIISTTWFLQN